jgi:glycosyltransferase involved in cell wall biosynthesis
MLNNKTIAVVIPAYNEEKQIGLVIETIPDFVDKIIIINDNSTDKTENVVKSLWYSKLNEGITIRNITEQVIEGRFENANRVLQNQMKLELKFFLPSQVLNKNPETERLILINQTKNAGVGAAVARGYKWCKDHRIDCIAKLDGDGQMDPAELESICRPVIEDGIDYVKGNRLIHGSAFLVIPKVRFLGNSILSILTKIASGYWSVSDTQTAFTAISNKALNSIKLHKLYHTYGYPNDILVKLNIASCTLKEVEIKPVYEIGEKSKMKIWKIIIPISWLLLKSFFKRLWIKYFFRDFHPLFILYNLSFLLFIVWIPYLIKMTGIILSGTNASIETLFAFTFLGVTSMQFLLFAMWMDIQNNERLYK